MDRGMAQDRAQALMHFDALKPEFYYCAFKKNKKLLLPEEVLFGTRYLYLFVSICHFLPGI